MKDLFKTYWKWIILILILVAVYMQWGGITLTIRNQSAYDLCNIAYSFEPIETEGGTEIPLINGIHARQSRDINLPVYLTWFKDGSTEELYVRTTRCSGEVVDHWVLNINDGNYFMREIR